jgi:hypothetical protein
LVTAQQFELVSLGAHCEVKGGIPSRGAIYGRPIVVRSKAFESSRCAFVVRGKRKHAPRCRDCRGRLPAAFLHHCDPFPGVCVGSVAACDASEQRISAVNFVGTETHEGQPQLGVNRGCAAL